MMCTNVKVTSERGSKKERRVKGASRGERRCQMLGIRRETEGCWVKGVEDGSRGRRKGVDNRARVLGTGERWKR